MNKDRRKLISAKNKIIEAYTDAVETFESSEWESAPSGEWAEYNVNKLQDESVMNGLQEAVLIVCPNYFSNKG